MCFFLRESKKPIMMWRVKKGKAAGAIYEGKGNGEKDEGLRYL